MSPTTSTASQDQQKMQTNTYTIGEIEKSIMGIFKEIKVRNGALKITPTISSGSIILVLKVVCCQPLILRKVKFK